MRNRFCDGYEVRAQEHLRHNRSWSRSSFVNSKRREFCALTGSAVVSTILGGTCRRATTFGLNSRLTARAHSSVKTSVTGMIALPVYGNRDAILHVPINSCSRRIVGLLTSRGCQVTFREFDGGHKVPDDIAREALTWFTR